MGTMMHKFGKLASFIRRQIRRLARNEAGATAIEYAMIASAIAVAIVAAVNELGVTTKGMFDSLTGLFK